MLYHGVPGEPKKFQVSIEKSYSRRFQPLFSFKITPVFLISLTNPVSIRFRILFSTGCGHTLSPTVPVYDGCCGYVRSLQYAYSGSVFVPHTFSHRPASKHFSTSSAGGSSPIPSYIPAYEPCTPMRFPSDPVLSVAVQKVLSLVGIVPPQLPVWLQHLLSGHRVLLLSGPHLLFPESVRNDCPPPPN